MTKKYKRYILPAIIVIFFIPGLVSPTVKVKTKFSLHKPVSAVYIGLSDPGKLPFWFEGFQKIEHVSGMPMIPGSAYRITWKHGNKTYSAIEKLVLLDWKKNLRLEMQLNGVQIKTDLFFYEIKHRTYVDGVHRISGNSFATRILLPWIKPVISKQIKKNFDNFREMMEVS